MVQLAPNGPPPSTKPKLESIATNRTADANVIIGVVYGFGGGLGMLGGGWLCDRVVRHRVNGRLQLAALDPGARRRYVGRMQVLLSRELPTLPLYYRRFFWIYDGRKLTPIATAGGLLNGLPLLENKLAFLPPR